MVIKIKQVPSCPYESNVILIKHTNAKIHDTAVWAFDWSIAPHFDTDTHSAGLKVHVEKALLMCRHHTAGPKQ
jgi:hypothetical protein